MQDIKALEIGLYQRPVADPTAVLLALALTAGISLPTHKRLCTGSDPSIETSTVFDYVQLHDASATDPLEKHSLAH